MRLPEIAKIVDSKQETILPNIEIHWLLTDSRTVSFPEHSLFFALVTERNNGHKYIEELYDKGVKNFVVSQPISNAEKMENANFLFVESTLTALQMVSAAKRSKSSAKVIGVTGSNGKTIVKEWLYQLLKDDHNIVKSPRSYNSQIGVPLSVWGIEADTDIAIIEAGISEKGEMGRLEKIVKPNIGIFTHLGDAHQVGFESVEEKCREKIALFKDSDTIIYCSDNATLDGEMKAHFPKTKLMDWGSSPNAKLRVVNIEKKMSHSAISLLYMGKMAIDVESSFTDSASIENVITAIATMLLLGYNATDLASRIPHLQSISMRLEVKDGVNGCVVIDDSYNYDFDSLNIALNFQSSQSAFKKLTKTIILSDIPNSYAHKDDIYEKIAKLVNAKEISRAILIGEEIGEHIQLFRCNSVEHYTNSTQFLQILNTENFRNELILLKGARQFQFEQISSALQLIVHQTTLEVDLNALISNFNYFRSCIHSNTKIVCMVKASAYGAGAAEVSRALQHHKCDYLAVAVADEGAELRRAGIEIPIIVMNPEIGALDTIINHRLEPEIYSSRMLMEFSKAVERQGAINYPIHLKIDSGMHRLGFEKRDLPQLIALLKSSKQLMIRSMFSHLAGSDSSTFDSFTTTQVETFMEIYTEISSHFHYPIMRHILNSAGIERFPQYQMDMVRLGIGLYGVSANEVQLENVCTLKTIILQKKIVKAGETVGYSRNGKVEKDMEIAVIPIGYADGFERMLGNGVGEVFVNGKRAKTIGNICMDLSIVDITGIDANEGDTVEIFGNNITIYEVAQKLQTIPYEVLTSVSKRVKRVYYVN